MNCSDLPVDLDAERVNELAMKFWYSPILRTAIKLDVFFPPEGVSLTPLQVAQRINASPRYAQSFADCCVVSEFLDEPNRKFIISSIISSMASRFLVKGKAGYVGDHALHHTNIWASWGRLDEIIREGKTLLPYETEFVDADTY